MEGIERLVTKLRKAATPKVARAKVARTKVTRTKVAQTKAARTKAAVRTEPEILPLILAQLEEDKAEATQSIDVRGRTSIADFMVVTTGRSNRHVAAIAEHLVEMLSKHGAKPRTEGLPAADWVLLDAGDIIVHIFRPEVREFYNLEKMWAGSRRPAKD